MSGAAISGDFVFLAEGQGVGRVCLFLERCSDTLSSRVYHRARRARCPHRPRRSLPCVAGSLCFRRRKKSREMFSLWMLLAGWVGLSVLALVLYYGSVDVAEKGGRVVLEDVPSLVMLLGRIFRSVWRKRSGKFEKMTSVTIELRGFKGMGGKDVEQFMRLTRATGWNVLPFFVLAKTVPMSVST